MEQLVLKLAEKWGLGPIGTEYLAVLFMVLVATIIAAGFATLFAGAVTWVERRVAGRIQSRIGPNRVGPQGILQWLADGLKAFFKEDFIPPEGDRTLFKMSVYFPVIGFFAVFAVLPFSQKLIAADLNVGVFYAFSVTSFTVIGIVFAGWASNNKWSLLGGMRSVAQIISYEVPIALSALVPIMIAGSLSTQSIISAQGGWPWQWFVFHNPFAFVAFFVFFVSNLAEGNRIPFDLPEGESELVSGYSTEYSGFRYLLFYLVEWGNLYVMAALSTLLFFGGWRIPGVSTELMASSWWYQLIGLVVFWIKAFTFVFIIIQIRWTLPRVRIDQFMNMAWKYMIPFAFVTFLGTGIWLMFPKWFEILTQWVLFLIGLGILGIFFWRVKYTLDYIKAKVDLKFFI